MGYTHYYEILSLPIWDLIYPQLISDANTIIDAAGIPLANSDGFHNSKPTVFSGIRINDAANPCESFILLKEWPQWPPEFGPNKHFQFCKTGRNLYDLVVGTILLRARMLAGKEGFRLNSDGEWDNKYSTWVAAKELYAKLWPEEEEPTEAVLNRE